MLLGKLRILVLLLNSILISIYSLAQESQTNPAPTHHHTHSHGKIVGKVIDKNTGEPLIGAVVQIPSINKGAQTDLDGKFVIKVPVGTYDVTIKYISYATQNYPGIVVTQGAVTDLNAVMEEETKETKEVVITAKVEKESNNFILLERKNSAQVSDGISSETIKKTPDRSTADVLKRVTGASIQDGKFAIIRGMNDRYNAGYLNGAPLPSTESDRKAFAFDVIPANLIDNLQIIKTASPDLTGDFAGGIIQINTKNIPTEFSQNISIGGQYNSLTTFKSNDKMGSESGDFLGLKGDRNLPNIGTELTNPKSKPTTVQVASSKLFNDDYSIKSVNSAPNLRLNYSLGFPVKLNDKGMELGVLFAYNYANTKTFKNVSLYNNDPTNNLLMREFNDKNYNTNVTNGGLLNLGYKLNPNHFFYLRNTLNSNSDYTTILRYGAFDYTTNIYNRSYGNVQNFNTLLSSQFGADHNFKVLKVKWLLNRAAIKREIPDYRLVTYQLDLTDASNPSTTLFLPQNFSQGSGRFWSNLNETVKSGNIDISAPLNFFGPAIKLEAKTGAMVQRRSRTFDSRSFVYQGGLPFDPSTPDKDLSSSNIGKANDSLYIKEKTVKIIDEYVATSELNAGYIMADIRVFKRFRATGGLRIENFKQTLTNDETDKLVNDDGSPKNAKIYDKPAVTNALPSVNLTYSLTEKMNLRGSIYKTVNRPEFRELAKFSFFNFALNAQFVGNDTLVQATINNYDIRYEFFPSANQVMSIGFFSKKIKNPIEYAVDISSTDRLFNFSNANQATINGVEMEVRKSFLKKFTTFANLSLIGSKVSFGANSTSAEGRPLQGQSPYIVNIGLQYEDFDKGWFASIVSNRNGRRIAYVGTKSDANLFPFGGDIYEKPRTVIDLQVGKEIGKFNTRLTIGDILHQDLIYYINLDDNKNFNTSKDNKVFVNNLGFTTTLTISYKF